MPSGSPALTRTEATSGSAATASSASRRFTPRRLLPIGMLAAAITASGSRSVVPITETCPTVVRLARAATGGRRNDASNRAPRARRRSCTAAPGVRRALRPDDAPGSSPLRRFNDPPTGLTPARRRLPPRPGRTPSGASPGPNGRAPAPRCCPRPLPAGLRSLIARSAVRGVPPPQQQVQRTAP